VTQPDFDVQPLTDANNQVSGQTSDERVKRYLINTQPGQVLKAEILSGAVTLTIRYPDGRPVENATGVVTWDARIFEGGEYQIDVVGTQPTDFTLNVAVQNGPSPVPENPPPPN
jgi:serine/threonine-protein kinase